MEEKLEQVVEETTQETTEQVDENKFKSTDDDSAVSYTHLTLPTKA